MAHPSSARWAAVAGLLLSGIHAEPVPVRHVQGYIHGFLVLKDTNDKIVASGDLTQLPAGGRVTVAFTLHFTDGSLYEETAVFSQNRVYRLLTYKQVMKGPAFKTPETLTLDASNGNVTVQYTDKDGTQKTVTDKLASTPDLANGLLPLFLTEADPKAETTLSMVVSTPKPRVVKLKDFRVGRGCVFDRRRARKGDALRRENRHRRCHGRRCKGDGETTTSDADVDCGGKRARFSEIRGSPLRRWAHLADRVG